MKSRAIVNEGGKMSALENAALTTKIKSVFILDERIDASGINVDTVEQGEVYLRGRVPSDVQARLAEDLARLNGARAVVNELSYDTDVEVTPEEAPAAAGVYGRITTSPGAPELDRSPVEMRIKDALDADPRVNAHLLKVERLEEGIVVLKGRQGTVGQRDAALEAASAVEDVEGVIDEIEIQPAY
jgi:osmotically-inducible protein OsmY